MKESFYPADMRLEKFACYAQDCRRGEKPYTTADFYTNVLSFDPITPEAKLALDEVIEAAIAKNKNDQQIVESLKIIQFELVNANNLESVITLMDDAARICGREL